MTRPSEIEDPHYARSCVEAWLPDEEVRRAVLNALADSMRRAHDRSPACWGLSLLPKKRMIRLNVGMVNVFVISESDRHFLLFNPENAKPPQRWSPQPAKYRSAPNSAMVHVPGVDFAEAYNLLRSAHFDCIALASARRSGYRWPERHSPGLLQYMRDSLGLDLPAPEYPEKFAPASQTQTWLLTWNPKRWSWQDLSDQAERTRHGERVPERWSCGNTKAIQPGDRIFLLRQGVEPRGVIAAGCATAFAVEDEHWDVARADEVALYVPCEFDRVLDSETEPPLDVASLDNGPFAEVHWNTQVSGIRIPRVAATALEMLWSEHVGRPTPRYRPAVHLDDELAAFEGEQRFHFVRHRSRETRLREAKIKEALKLNDDRLTCEVPGCGFDFFERYGRIGRQFAHVHHRHPLSTREAVSQTKLADFAIVCANCHAMIHRGGRCRPLEERIQREQPGTRSIGRLPARGRQS